MKRIFIVSLLSLFYFIPKSSAFCGFYVAKAGSELFNNRSQVVFVRDGNRSVITMSNDYQGDVSEFAMVVPVPTVLSREEIRIAKQGLFDKLDHYSGPRLVEYYDHNPCEPQILYEVAATMEGSNRKFRSTKTLERDKEDYQVTVEATYAVGEYDILILSAKESDGLKRWLTDNGYKIPAKAERVLEPYIKSNMKFFVVKVNTKVMKMQGFQNLRPLQISFESDRFMLPIRLGMANSKGTQDMIVYTLTRNGRVESSNYRTVQIPSNRDIPTFIKGGKFEQFYVDLFDKAYRDAGKNAVFTEYAWDVSPNYGGVKCDPCVGPPPIVSDLLDAGVWWIDERSYSQVFFTRLHVRYSEEKFPEDLFFIQTSDKERFQGRYVMRHAATGDLSCDEGKKYVQELEMRRGKELKELAALTDWNVAKYTRYRQDGSGWIDEKLEMDKSDSPGKTGKGAAPGMLLLLGGIFLFLFLNYIRDLRQIANGNR
ncbi:MAG: DUF2330 domain-containing protein [Flavobacteriales bacterium]|nr:DUF2330 domain-containing protein [Flavobacteriales bacterium]